MPYFSNNNDNYINMPVNHRILCTSLISHFQSRIGVTGSSHTYLAVTIDGMSSKACFSPFCHSKRLSLSNSLCTLVHSMASPLRTVSAYMYADGLQSYTDFDLTSIKSLGIKRKH